MSDLDLNELGQRVRDAQDELLSDPTTRRSARARIVNTHGASPRRSKRFALLVASAALACAALLFFATRDGGEESIIALIDTTPVGIGDPLVAPAARATRVDLSDGSSFALAPGSAAQLRSIDSRGAGFSLARGEAEVEVIHRDDTRFAIYAGPYTVHVIGTRFAARYDEQNETLAVQMREGRVRIEGPFGEVFASGTELVEVARTGPIDLAPIAATAIPLEDPEHVDPVDDVPSTHEAGSPVAGTLGVASAEAAGIPSAEPPDTTEVRGSDVTAASPSSAVRSAKRAVTSSRRPRSFEDRRRAFRRAMERGEYADALSHMNDADRERLRARGDAHDLLRLATAERRGGLSSAGETLTRLRTRFPDSGPAADALFLLARRNFRSRRYAAAADEFARYLEEAPQGRHRRDAAGRLIEARRAAGQTDGATRAAERYLSLYPEGPHQNVAREVLGR